MKSERGQTLAEVALGGFGICIVIVIVLAILGPSFEAFSASARNVAASIDASLPQKEMSNLTAFPALDTLDQDIEMSLTLDDIDTRTGHADTKHADDAEAVRECLRKQSAKGPLQAYQRWTRPSRYLFVCEVNPWEWGIQVVEQDPITGKFRSVTAFIKDTLKSLGDVNAYLEASEVLPVTLP